MNTASGRLRLPAPPGRRRVAALLLSLLWLSACSPAPQAHEDLRQEIQGLKAQLTALQEKLNQVQTDQQVILALLKPSPPAAPPAESLMMPVQPPGPAPACLTVSQLLTSKDRYLGTRVTVKGMPGPVMVHHKSLLLKSPQGMLEVLFGNLPDPKLVQSLTSTPLDRAVTVTGVVNLPPPRGGGAQLQINAEAIEF